MYYYSKRYFVPRHYIRESSEEKGSIGEKQAYWELYKIEGHKQLFYNILLSDDHRSTHEIDLIMVHGTGIYVFEVKNYSGWIYGNENHQTWTQTFPHGEKYHFQNPIIQNNKHVKVLNRIITHPNRWFFNVIVFGNNCELKSIEKFSTAEILQMNDLYMKTKYNCEHSVLRLSDEDVDRISKQIWDANIKYEATRASHIETVKNIKK